ncbi:hypothetical protein CSKR_108541 [Clonorchis sinensis]|uniref:Uncharacterized protein n=1 Tax=Clonorchis sinensis TaxID=79923 RepID=A0A419QHS5_CLOSI|nr:hypothetical protein CSKR_108541 [Clonorchis sinensis]
MSRFGVGNTTERPENTLVPVWFQSKLVEPQMMSKCLHFSSSEMKTKGLQKQSECFIQAARKRLYAYAELNLIIGQGSKTLICILFTKLNIHLVLKRIFLNFPGCSLTVTQMQANATK